LRADAAETSATWLAQAAMREAELGFAERAIELADAALERSEGRFMRCLAAYALARAGDHTVADQAIHALETRFPEDTVIRRYWGPCVRAAMALDSRDWVAAVRALEPAESMELALVAPFEGGFLIPPYLRGLAYAAGGKREDAAREFEKITSRPGLVKNYITYPLAARAREALP
jgi:hypothetical protein